MNTRKTIHKVYLAWDFKKEELWLNEMAAEGWALEHAAFCSYTFVHCEPGEYIIRILCHNRIEKQNVSLGKTAIANFSPA